MESMEFFEELRSIRSRAEELSDAVIEIRRDLHQHPELSGKEFRTAVRIEEELDKLGISHRRVGETGVLGILQGTMGKPQRVVALRADIDALPITENIQAAWRSENAGVMHACGHDVHTACLLGAARILTERKDSFAGEVRLFFQQAEEIDAFRSRGVNIGNLWLWPYDQGGCLCPDCSPWGANGFLRITKQLSTMIREKLPEMQWHPRRFWRELQEISPRKTEKRSMNWWKRPQKG